jgi:hypothetical protein
VQLRHFFAEIGRLCRKAVIIVNLCGFTTSVSRVVRVGHAHEIFGCQGNEPRISLILNQEFLIHNFFSRVIRAIRGQETAEPVHDDLHVSDSFDSLGSSVRLISIA